MTDASDIFQEITDTYDERRHRLVPHFDQLYGCALDALA